MNRIFRISTMLILLLTGILVMPKEKGMPVNAAGSLWYIDKDAHNTEEIYDGTSWERAYRSFEEIPTENIMGSYLWRDIEAGDTIYISGGTNGKTYDESLEVKKTGEQDNPIVIRPGQDPGHNGPVTLNRGITVHYSKDYITIDGNVNGERHLIIKSPNGIGISIYATSNVTVNSVEVTDCGDSSDNHGIGINAAHRIKIDNAYIHDIYQDGINFNSGGTDYEDCVITNTLIENVGDDGIQAGSGVTIHDCVIDGRRTTRALAPGAHPDAIQTGVGANYFRIYNNIIENFGQCLFIEKTTGFVEMYNNVIYQDPDYNSGTGRAVSISPHPDNPLIGHVLFANNVMYNFNSYFAAQFGFYGQFSSTDTVIFANNITMNNKVHYGGQTELIESQNIFYSEPDAKCYDSSGPPEQPCDYSCPESTICSNPLFTNLAMHDFTIRSDSPGRDQGRDLSQYFNTDFNGNPREPGAWDIGAYEFAPNLNLNGTPGNQTIALDWTVSSELPATSTWTINYESPGSAYLPVTGILSPTRAYTLTDLTNNIWYTVTLNAMLGTTPLLTDTVTAMPHAATESQKVYLPLVLKSFP